MWDAASQYASQFALSKVENEAVRDVTFGMSQFYDDIVKGEVTDLVLDPEKRAELYGKIMGAVDRFAVRQCAQEGQGE